jgi:hypothetical protein
VVIRHRLGLKELDLLIVDAGFLHRLTTPPITEKALPSVPTRLHVRMLGTSAHSAANAGRARAISDSPDRHVGDAEHVADLLERPPRLISTAWWRCAGSTSHQPTRAEIISALARALEGALGLTSPTTARE